MTQPWDRYVEDRFDADLRRWHPDGYRSDASHARPVAPFLAALPGPGAASLARWDTLARARAIPDMFRFEEGGLYGSDFAASEVEVYDDGVEVSAGLWTLGHEGGGNRYCVLPSGEVRVWNHETSELESHNRFPGLDAFAWALVRVGAVEAGTLDRDSPEAAEVMDSPEAGSRFLVAQLVEWLEE